MIESLQIDLNEKIRTGDAIFFQKDFCTAIVESGADCVFVLKKNHPNLYNELVRFFAGM